MPSTNARLSLIPPYGGYRELQSYQMAEIVYDVTVELCKKALPSPLAGTL